MERPYKGKDYIDSRNVIDTIEEFESDREALVDAVKEAKEALDEAMNAVLEAEEAVDLANHGTSQEISEACAVLNVRKEAFENAQKAYDVAKADLEEWDDSPDAENLKELKELNDKCENEGDWSHGVTLIHESAFEDYAKQTAEDLGLISSDTQWPATCIDWGQAADELKQDYTCIEWGEETYYMRSY